MSNQFIPFVDLKSQYHSIKDEIDNAISSVIGETAFIKGRFVKTFEDQFREKYGVNHCIGVANGTDAIYIVLKMLGIGEGDEVITVANSWISTSETISQTGARPVFIDADEYFTIDAEKIEEKINPKTKAIIPVHLYGQVCDMDPIRELCKRYGLLLVEDCAQSHFSEYKGIKAGLFGNAATFSFFPGKNLGAYGDAGCIITNNDSLAEKCRMYANHGALVKHHHLVEGINSRLDGLQAAILSVKLKYLDQWNRLRIKNAAFYDQYLRGIPEIITPKVRPDSIHTFHLYVIKTRKRNELRQFLQDCGISCEIHYPTPLPLLPAYQYLHYRKEDFPVVTGNQPMLLSLPIFPELSEDQIAYISEQIQKFYSILSIVEQE